MTLGDIIAEYRKEHQMSMDKFADISKISKGYISMLERNQTQRGEEPSPSYEMYKNVAKTIGMDVDELIRKVEGKISLTGIDTQASSIIGCDMDWLEAFNTIRKESGMSLDELSEASGVPKSTLSKITSGITKSPSIETMRTLVHAMGRTLDDLDPKEKEPTNIKVGELSEHEKIFTSLPPDLRQEALRYMGYLLERFAQEKENENEMIGYAVAEDGVHFQNKPSKEGIERTRKALEEKRRRRKGLF